MRLTPETVRRPYTVEQVADSDKAVRAAMERAFEGLEFPAPKTPKVYQKKGRLEAIDRIMLGTVYFFVCDERFVKIGWSTDVPARFQKVQSTNPFPLEIALTLPGGVAEEFAFHVRFAAYRHQLEWFRYEGELREFVEKERVNANPVG